MSKIKDYIKNKLEAKLSEIPTPFGHTITPDVIDGVYESLKNGHKIYEIVFESYMKGNGFMYPCLDRVVPTRSKSIDMVAGVCKSSGRYLIFLDPAECRQEQIEQIFDR